MTRKLTIAFVASLLTAGTASAQSGAAVRAEMLDGLEWRSIGPAVMGGRVTDIAAIAGDPSTFYVGTAAGGVIKTTNGGISFEPIFDEVAVPSVGALGLAPSNPNVLYVGTGEGNPRNSVSVGRGMYKSTDAGETWNFVGLRDTERFSRIRVHPTDPDLVYAAALGREWGPNEERGVFRSTDGGRSWEKVLYVDENTGAADLAMDPEDPRILYAAMYDYRRKPWHFRSGGPGSGLYRSADGGATWTNLTAQAPGNGLPEGVLGRMAVQVAPSDPNIVYTMIESLDEHLVWRSDDRGLTWTPTTKDPVVNSRPFYYTDLRIDPANPDRLFSLSSRLALSEDGGRTWKTVGGDMHPDHHAMWFDPTDPRRIINGNDGGVYLSNDAGATWRYLNHFPLGQFYQIGVDMRDPYFVCGGMQDNGVWCGPNETRKTAGLLNEGWYIIHFGDGYYAQIDPTDPTSIYTNAHYGNIVRVDLESFEKQSIQPYPVSLRGSAPEDHPYRFNWNSPVYMSPHDPKVVYFGSNVLFRTEDGGHSWVAVSPDLTTDDPEKQKPSGGPITPDNTSAEYHTTILTIAESPLQEGVIWVGTDDGNVQVTRNGGKTWTNVVGNIPGLPSHSWVSRIEPSRTAPGAAYATFDRHRDDDMRPYVFKTTDFGRSWTNITANLPEYGWLHVVREDPRNPNLLYVGSEFGLHASFDGGRSWVTLTGHGGLPPAPVADLLVHPRDNDLVVGTHGRSIFILDDVTPLQRAAEAVSTDTYLFEPPVATRLQPHFDKPFQADGVFRGETGASEAIISFYLESPPSDSVQLIIRDEGGEQIRSLTVPAESGFQRVEWDLGYDPLGEPRGRGGFGGGAPALRALPGTYSVELRAGGESTTRPLRIRADPTLEVGLEDLEAQHAAALRLTRMAARADRQVKTIETVSRQLDSLRVVVPQDAAGRAEIDAAVDALETRLAGLRSQLVSELGGYRSAAMLQGRIESLLGDIGGTSVRPTAAQLDWIERFDAQLEEISTEVEDVVARDVPALNEQVAEAGVSRILVVPRR